MSIVTRAFRRSLDRTRLRYATSVCRERARFQRTSATQSATSLLPALPRPTHSLSLSDFSLHLRSQYPTPLCLPSLIAGKADNPYAWPALTSWGRRDIDGKETLGGLRDVPGLEEHVLEVEVGRKGRGYMDMQDGTLYKAQMPFGIFLDAFIVQRIRWANPDQIGYVAQQDLISAVPDLALACPPLPHSSAGPRGDREQWPRDLWVGPEGTFTPIHRDPYENLFVQVIGSKRVHLFPPSCGPSLYLPPHFTLQSNTSAIPSEDYLLEGGSRDCDAKSFPLLTQAMSVPGAVSTTLEPGDALYIPKGWFHCVKSMETSVSVNSWWR